MRSERGSLHIVVSRRPCLVMTDEVMPIERRAFRFSPDLGRCASAGWRFAGRVQAARHRETTRTSAKQWSTRMAGQSRFPGVCAGQRFGVHRSGGPKVGSSNLPSPTTRTSTTSHEVESSVSSSPSNQHGRLPARANAARSAGVIQATVPSDGYMKLLGSVEWPTPKMWASSCSTLS